MYLQTSRLHYTLRFSDCLSQKAISFNKNFYNQARRQDLQIYYSIVEGKFSTGRDEMTLSFQRSGDKIQYITQSCLTKKQLHSQPLLKYCIFNLSIALVTTSIWCNSNFPFNIICGINFYSSFFYRTFKRIFFAA